jgi:hypothetical protein
MTQLQVETLTVELEPIIDNYPKNSKIVVVFEDERTTLYFYAIKRYFIKEIIILDGIHIYNVDNIISQTRRFRDLNLLE